MYYDGNAIYFVPPMRNFVKKILHMPLSSVLTLTVYAEGCERRHIEAAFVNIAKCTKRHTWPKFAMRQRKECVKGFKIRIERTTASRGGEVFQPARRRKLRLLRERIN